MYSFEYMVKNWQGRGRGNDRWQTVSNFSDRKCTINFSGTASPWNEEAWRVVKSKSAATRSTYNRPAHNRSLHYRCISNKHVHIYCVSIARLAEYIQLVLVVDLSVIYVVYLCNMLCSLEMLDGEKLIWLSICDEDISKRKRVFKFLFCFIWAVYQYKKCQKWRLSLLSSTLHLLKCLPYLLS